MNKRVLGSFRDPSGFLFLKDNILYRQVNNAYKHDYEQLITSGLYERLTKSKAMVSHVEDEIHLSPEPDLVYKVIKPEIIDFISYPYEWCFSQLKEAALLTLAIAKRSLKYGMTLKDASAYNVQFHNGRAIFIDSLSFKAYKEGEPWVAYKQFCQHFLAPLSLMVYRDIRLNKLLQIYIDGLPLDLTSKLLPFKTKLNFGTLSHIHLHAKSQARYANQPIDKDELQASISLTAHERLLENLISTVKALHPKKIQMEWTEYYQNTNYSSQAFETKKHIISSFISQTNPKTVWDLGANTGEFSRIASDQGIMTVAFDIDPGAVTQNYKILKEKKEKYILPLIMDLTNPSPSIGWCHQERSSLIGRGPADLVLALALIHHLAISNNVPLISVADFLARLSQFLIIEFVPKSDSQVKRLLLTREDIFSNYSEKGFEEAFSQLYKILDKRNVDSSERILYLMEKKIRG